MPGAHPHHSNTPGGTHSLHPNLGRICSKLPESQIPEAPTQPNAPTPCNPHLCIHRLTTPCISPSLYPKVHKPPANPHPCIHRLTTSYKSPSLQFPITASASSQSPANAQSCIHMLTTAYNSPSLHPQAQTPLQISLPAIPHPCIHRFTTPCNSPSLYQQANSAFPFPSPPNLLWFPT